ANASAGTWTWIGTNQVASSPTSGAGYPIPAGSRVPDAGTCRSGPFNANHSESWIAVQPDSENLVGSSKFFFDKFSTFYMFYLGAYQVTNGQLSNNQDHVYAAWAVFNGNGGGTKVRLAVSRDRGVTFAQAVTISPPSQVGAAATYVYPEIDAAGDLYVAVVSFPPNGGPSTIYVTRSRDDAQTFAPFVAVATPSMIPTAGLPNTRFRDGI